MNEQRLLAVQVNPLEFLEVDEPWATVQPTPVTAEAVLELLTAPGLGHDIPSLVVRDREISGKQPRLFAAPAEDRILEKLVWPLRHAKASYSRLVSCRDDDQRRGPRRPPPPTCSGHGLPG